MLTQYSSPLNLYFVVLYLYNFLHVILRIGAPDWEKISEMSLDFSSLLTPLHDMDASGLLSTSILKPPWPLLPDP
jgi:hypothetical protein